MDSMAAEEDETRAAKRARLTTPSAAGDDADLISGLDDDVLLRILALFPDASDAVRTGALSRRWCRLWTRVPALRFASRQLPGESSAAAAAALERYAAFVNGVLARRARSGCAIESLSIVYAPGSKSDERSLEQQPLMPASVNPATLLISPPMACETGCNMQQLMPAYVDAAQGWIRNAFRYGVKSFFLNLRLPPYSCGQHGGHEVLLDGLPSPAMLETMRLALCNARLWLPSTVKFASLVDLSLESIEIGGAHLLGRLMSSASCPRLQKLCMRKINLLHAFDEEMRLEADVLSELWMEDVHVLRSLKLRTPNLRVFHIYKCSQEMLTISAPRLEELAISFQRYPLRWIEVVNGGLSCVRSLKICLWSHCSCGVSCHRDAENDTNMLLLKKCSSLTCLDVTLYGGLEEFEEEEDMIKSRIPQLPHITSLIVNVSIWFERHEFGASVASLLTRFRNLRHLIVHLPIFLSLGYSLPKGLDLLCDHPDHWEPNEISMAYLQELELTGFTGTDCELWFIKAILISAKSVRKVALSFNQDCCQHQDKMDAFERMLLGGGMWTFYRDTHRLTCLR